MPACWPTAARPEATGEGPASTSPAHIATNAAFLATSLAKAQENPALFQGQAPAESSIFIANSVGGRRNAHENTFIISALQAPLSYNPAVAL